MLEIILIISLTRRLAAKASAKGLSTMWGGLLVANWIAGEVLGYIVGMALGLDMGAYGVALLGAGLGAGIAFAIVGAMGSRETHAMALDGEGIGEFRADNPYSPPGTYPAR